LIIGFLLVF